LSATHIAKWPRESLPLATVSSLRDHHAAKQRSLSMIVRRLFAALVGIAFFLVTTDPMAGHRCSAQDGVAPTSATMPGMPGMPGRTHDHGHTPDHGHRCACLGCCCCTPLVTIAGGRLVALSVVPIAIVATTGAPTAPRPSKPDSVVLPPPLGPPLGLLV
jgi:hypothetical protein